MIRLVVGPRGSGKSTWVVRELVRMVERGEDDKVLVTNVALRDCFWAGWRGGRVALRPEQVTTFWRFCPPGSLIVLDEVQVIFNSRAWSKLQSEAPDFLTFLSHSRKSKDELYLITQEPKRIDAQLRGQVDIVYDVNSTMWLRETLGLPVPFDLVWVREYAGCDQQFAVASRGGVFFCRRFFRFFDSYSMEIASSANLRRGGVVDVALVGGRGFGGRRVSSVERWAGARVERGRRRAGGGESGGGVGCAGGQA